MARPDPAALAHWRALRAHGEIQFAPLPPPAPYKPPFWLEWLVKALEWLARLFARLFGPAGHALGGAWPWMASLAVVLGAGLVLAAGWWLVRRWPARRRHALADKAAPWAPDAAEAAALLADAESLAAAGAFDEAVHLLLARSVAQIAAARPGLLHPATTARELAGQPRLPAAARMAFGLIAARVEQCRYALRPLALADWQAARAAYADFAQVPLAEGAAR